jgi:hypothetical protein
MIKGFTRVRIALLNKNEILHKCIDVLSQVGKGQKPSESWRVSRNSKLPGSSA